MSLPIMSYAAKITKNKNHSYLNQIWFLARSNKFFLKYSVKRFICYSNDIEKFSIQNIKIKYEIIKSLVKETIL